MRTLLIGADLEPGTFYSREGEPLTVCRVVSPVYRYSVNKIRFHDVEVWGARSDGRVVWSRKRADVPVVALSEADVLDMMAEQRRRMRRATGLEQVAA